MSIQIFKYNDTDITFNAGQSTMVSATEMAKAFGKLPKDYLKLDTTKAFIEAYMQEYPDRTNILSVVKGGFEQGTWMHEDIALDFAQWLSPRFKVWVNARLKDLLTTGAVALPQNDDAIILQSMNILQNRLSAAQEQLQLANSTIQAQAPKIKALGEIMGSESLLTTTEVAQNLQLSAVTLNKKLAEKKIQHRVNNSWVLNARYLSEGYARLIPVPYTATNGEQKTAQQLKWTEKGRDFIRQTFQP